MCEKKKTEEIQKATLEYLQVLKESQTKPKPELQLGLVEAQPKKKREIKMMAKQTEKFKVEPRVVKKPLPMSSEQRELELIKEKGQFKALPLKRTILERQSYEPKKVERE